MLFAINVNLYIFSFIISIQSKSGRTDRKPGALMPSGQANQLLQW